MFSSKTDASMYNHAKMGRIQDLKRKLYAMIAQDPRGKDDVLDHETHGLGVKTAHADDPVDLADDPLEIDVDDGGEHPDDSDPMAQMAREFKPKVKPRRPGTAMLIAAATKPDKSHHPYGAKGRARKF